MADQTQRMLLDAERTLQRGEKNRARKLLDQIILSEPRNARAWLLLADAVVHQNERLDCAKQVLKIEPGNVEAEKMLASLRASDQEKGEWGDSTIQDGLELENHAGRGIAWLVGGLVAGIFVTTFVLASQDSASGDLRPYLLKSLIAGGFVMVGIWAIGVIRGLKKSR